MTRDQKLRELLSDVESANSRTVRADRALQEARREVELAEESFRKALHAFAEYKATDSPSGGEKT